MRAIVEEVMLKGRLKEPGMQWPGGDGGGGVRKQLTEGSFHLVEHHSGSTPPSCSMLCLALTLAAVPL